MAQINVNTEHLLKIASYIEDAGDDLNDYSGNMEKISGSVESAWKSSSTGTYEEELQTVKTNMTKLSREAKDIAKVIRDYVAEIKRIEQENANMLKG